jgi:hypothetical protein
MHFSPGNAEGGIKNFMKQHVKVIRFQWIVVAVFSILMVLLIYQNVQLKANPYSQLKLDPKVKSLTFEESLNNRFLFKKFPMNLKIDQFKFYKQYATDYVNNSLILIFDFTVCGKCLYEELAVLNEFKEQLTDKKINILAIIGISGQNEIANIIALHKAGEIFFPCKIIPVDLLYSTFGLNKEHFIDTPFYIYTSHQFQVLDTFKPQYLETKEFKKWLSILANQDIL